MGDGTAGIGALDDILSQLRIDVIGAYFSQCSPVWREIDYVPAHNKLYYICEGEGWLRIGDKELLPEPGELVVMPANVLQSFSAIEGRRPFLKYWCHFTADIGDAGLFSWLDVPYRLTVDAELREEVGRKFEALVACAAERGIGARLREKAYLLELLAPVVERAALSRTGGTAEDAERIMLITRYVETHLAEELTLDGLADYLHLHPNYLVKYFNQRFGMPPIRYVNRKRMERARLLLRTTDRSIKEIAAAVGYPDTNHFAKAFRRETSASPSAYRAAGGVPGEG
ncbi:AraC family transcriptional regulator [Cohnella rhizosphaerae]|uniref:AraC family transcriptional regulator n=1 Tax=Cohnella rhizosphaerae TaxID=1457232 RepID=A0A9X4QWT7_9BACL|nr:AraC family transcriptional regulator [Cohnella rhizosphaerae]MDG0814150.1 AraC family transcriptional regulator [Cohnella rhizosphaerae]